MTNPDSQQSQPSGRTAPPPGEQPDLANEAGARREPVHPDDIDADGGTLGGKQRSERNPLADSPDDAE